MLKFKKHPTGIMAFQATVTRKWEPLYFYTTKEKREFKQTALRTGSVASQNINLPIT
jgi:hypothetical protein